MEERGKGGRWNEKGEQSEQQQKCMFWIKGVVESAKKGKNAPIYQTPSIIPSKPSETTKCIAWVKINL